MSVFDIDRGIKFKVDDKEYILPKEFGQVVSIPPLPRQYEILTDNELENFKILLLYLKSRNAPQYDHSVKHIKDITKKSIRQLELIIELM